MVGDILDAFLNAVSAPVNAQYRPFQQLTDGKFNNAMKKCMVPSQTSNDKRLDQHELLMVELSAKLASFFEICFLRRPTEVDA